MNEAFAIALFDFEGKSLKQLSIKAGESIKVKPYSKNWLYAYFNSSSQGIVPKSFVRNILIPAHNVSIPAQNVSIPALNTSISALNVSINDTENRNLLDKSDFCFFVCLVLFLLNLFILIYLCPKKNHFIQ